MAEWVTLIYLYKKDKKKKGGEVSNKPAVPWWSSRVIERTEAHALML